MASVKRILTLIETSSAYGRKLLEGIGVFAETHGRWNLFVGERGINDLEPKWLKHWKGDGVIFRSTSLAMLESVRRCGAPAVETNAKFRNQGFPLVYLDNGAVGTVACNHFLERGFDSFGFCGVEDEPWVELRQQAFVSALAEKQFTCHVWRSTAQQVELPWERQLDDLMKWVQGLPKPIAILAANDLSGNRLINACRSAGVAVPEEVAVLGVDDDTAINRLSSPPLSSIDLDATRIGYEAAWLLNEMMNGEASPNETILIPPLRVVNRQSTDITAVKDLDLAAALTFIRQHACDGITVGDVVKQVSLSRATLERRFSSEIGRTPKGEIFRVRMKHVQQYLKVTDYGLAEISEMTGFASPFHLSTAFKRHTGQSPSDYRRENKKDGF